MHPLDWSRRDAELALAAMKAVFSLYGKRDLAPIHAEFLLAMRDAVFRQPGLDPLAARPIGPGEFAALVPVTEHRERALEYLTIVPYVDVAIEAAKAELVGQYFAFVGRGSDALKFLDNIAHQHVRASQFCIARKLLPKLLPGGPMTQVTRAIRMLRENCGDAAKAARFQALGRLPERTLGNVFYRFHRARGFALPGEPGCMPEDLLATHDITHMLSGYNTDANGEICANAFAGGSMPKHALMIAVTGLLSFHNKGGLDQSGKYAASTGNLNPREFANAFQRGMESTCLVGWDYHRDWEVSVDALRARFNIRDAADIWDDPPSEEAMALMS
jgi:ubiquinone biosynthesis protein Coq4